MDLSTRTERVPQWTDFSYLMSFDGLAEGKVLNSKLSTVLQYGKGTNNGASTLSVGHAAVQHPTGGVKKGDDPNNNFLGVVVVAALATEEAAYQSSGEAQAQASGSVTAGDYIRVDQNNGRFIKREIGDSGQIVGVALTSATDQTLFTLALITPVRLKQDLWIFKFPQIISGLSSDLILEAEGTSFVYHGPDLNLVRANIKSGMPDTGTQPSFDVDINGADVFSIFLVPNPTPDTFGVEANLPFSGDDNNRILSEGDVLTIPVAQVISSNGDGYDTHVQIVVEERLVIS